MSFSISRRQFHQSGLAVSLPLMASSLSVANQPKPRRVIRIVVGPSKHPPGTHEVAATGRLLKFAIDQLSERYGWVDTRSEIMDRWPADPEALNDTATFVFVGDFFPPMRMENTSQILSDLERQMAAGTGIVCIHYATGLGANDVPDDGSHPLLSWTGGYFATRCKHHQSIARIFKEATIKPSSIAHPVLNGWKSFTLNDEPYINNYFGPNGPSHGVQILATSDLPPESPKAEPIAWCRERADSGRGVGVVMPHFFRNWLDRDMRTFLLNSIVWSAKLSVPEAGLECELPDLASFQPDSVEPIPPKKAKA